MSLGGGTFTVQNKVLPGTYINFVSASSANAGLSDRGIAAMPLELDWGIPGEVFEVSGEDFQKRSREIFGYEYTSPRLKGLRDLFLNARTLYAYRLNSSGKKAENALAQARYPGTRGNDLRIECRPTPTEKVVLLSKLSWVRRWLRNRGQRRRRTLQRTNM